MQIPFLCVLEREIHFLSEKDLAVDGFCRSRANFKREKPLSSLNSQWFTNVETLPAVTSTLSFGLLVVLSICMV